jgi:hypothetical protein
MKVLNISFPRTNSITTLTGPPKITYITRCQKQLRYVTGSGPKKSDTLYHRMDGWMESPSLPTQTTEKSTQLAGLMINFGCQYSIGLEKYD